MLIDLRFALRQLFKSPGFTLLAVITLTLGIGLNTAIFSLVNDLFLRGLPFKDPGRLVQFHSGEKTAETLEWPLSAPRFQLYREGQTLFDGFAADNGVAVHFDRPGRSRPDRRVPGHGELLRRSRGATDSRPEFFA